MSGQGACANWIFEIEESMGSIGETYANDSHDKKPGEVVKS